MEVRFLPSQTLTKRQVVTPPSYIYAAALNNIFTAKQGLRIFDRFGFNLRPDVTRKKTCATIVKDYEEWLFASKNFDWFNTQTGETLSKFHPLFKVLVLWR